MAFSTRPSIGCSLLLGATVGCSGNDARPSFIDAPTGPLPSRLSAMGLYDQGARPTHPRAVRYEPRYPLYSNGSDKERLLVLPAGMSISGVGGAWDFPEGTLLFKTFFFDDGPVETRVIRRGPGGYDYAAYLWDADGRDATLLDGDDSTPTDVRIEGAALTHEIPSRRECEKCHESSPTRVLGFRQLQLTDPDDGVEALRALVDRGVLPTDAARDPELITATGPTTHAVLGYLEGNCVHCHNGSDGIASSYDLGHAVALEAIVDRETQSSASAPGTRVVPGYPEESILFLAFSGETDNPEVKAMPPLGVQRIDAEAVELFRSWIESLGEGGDE